MSYPVFASFSTQLSADPPIWQHLSASAFSEVEGSVIQLKYLNHWSLGGPEFFKGLHARLCVVPDLQQKSCLHTRSTHFRRKSTGLTYLSQPRSGHRGTFWQQSNGMQMLQCIVEMPCT